MSLRGLLHDYLRQTHPKFPNHGFGHNVSYAHQPKNIHLCQDPWAQKIPPVNLFPRKFAKFSWRFNKKSSHLSFQQTPVQPFWVPSTNQATLWCTSSSWWSLWALEPARVVTKKSGSDRWIRWNVTIPIPSMYGIFYLHLVDFYGNVGKYTIHGCYGICSLMGPKSLLWAHFFKPSYYRYGPEYAGKNSVTTRNFDLPM